MLINRLNLAVVVLLVDKVLYTLCYVIVTIRVSVPPELLIRPPGIAVCPSVSRLLILSRLPTNRSLACNYMRVVSM
jgi:hypothetical protein